MSLSLKGKTATVFGGTGFVGRYIVARLARAGAIVRVITRHPSSAYFLRTNGVVGQIVPVLENYKTSEGIDRAIAGSDVVVNCLGVLHEKRGSSFARIHTELPQLMAEACARHGVQRFVHISALGVDQSQSNYAKSKVAGETAVRQAFPNATILRPSVIFGPEDNFFNMFAGLARIAPALPLIGGGHTKFQPVYVADVADAAIQALTLTDTGPATPFGKTYELGGPEILTFRNVYERIFAQTRRTCALISIPWALARVKATCLSILPNPPLTNDQVTSLKTDNVVKETALQLHDLGIQPTALDAILPTYLDRFISGGRFAEKKRA